MRRILSVLVLWSATGCATATNYTNPFGPRYAGSPVTLREPSGDRPLRVVSFNVRFGRNVGAMIALMLANDSLRDPDILLLQEMDERGVRMVAESLGLSYVYYPAIVHPATHRDFGNAILTPWPISDDSKFILPHLARVRHSQKAAVGATVTIGGREVRVYSVHIATMVGNGPTERRDQLRVVLADADRFPVVVIGGDFNSETVPDVALAHGFAWPTRGLAHTNAFWTMDHILLKGIAPVLASDRGTLLDAQGASDHRPVWALVRLAPGTTLER